MKDCYHLRELPFVPDVVFDIGANVGTFTSYTRFLFPNAVIVAVEPNPRNFELLVKHTGHLPSVVHLNVALGTGTIWHLQRRIDPPWFGGMEQYVSAGQLGFPAMPPESDPGYRLETIGAVSLETLVQNYAGRRIAKIDIEGGENYIFSHEPSMAALRLLDYIAMETHYPINGWGPVPEPNKATIGQSLLSLVDTHDCILDTRINYFQAIKRGMG